MCTFTAEQEVIHMAKPFTFAMFQASGRDVDDLSKALPDLYEARKPGRLYAGDLVIEESLGAAEGAWMLTIAEYSECSNNLAELEHELYQYGCDNGHFEEAPEEGANSKSKRKVATGVSRYAKLSAALQAAEERGYQRGYQAGERDGYSAGRASALQPVAQRIPRRPSTKQTKRNRK
jgi:hypothetical protein